MQPYLQVSRDAARALEEFSEEFRGALVLGEITPWAANLGLVRNTEALKTTFPLPIDAAGYKEFKGDPKYRTLYHRSMSMVSRLWQDGVEEFIRVIEAPDFIDWAGAPANMAREWARQPNLLVADLLAESSLNGPLLNFYDDPDTKVAGTRRLFAADHPYNVFKEGLGTFDNRLSTTVAEIESGAFFDEANAYFRSIKGPNGKPLGLRLGGGSVLAPATRENLFKNNLEQDTLVRAVTNLAGTENVAATTKANLWKGTIGYTIADELEDQNHFYIFAAGRPGLYPWAIQMGSPQETIFDASSERARSTLKVSISYVGQMNAMCALPHGIARVEITG